MLSQGVEQRQVAQTDIDEASQRLVKLNESTSGESIPALRAELQQVMQNHFGVFRSGDFMKEGVQKLEALRERLNNIYLEDIMLFHVCHSYCVAPHLIFFLIHIISKFEFQIF